MIDFNNAPPQSPPNKLDSLRLPILKQRLQANAASFVQELFPAAVIRNGEARLGDIHGAPGESLQITLMGDMCGVWVDHADDSVKGGDLISLYAAAEGLDLKSDFPKILDDLEAWAGITRNPKPRSVKQVAREAHKATPNPHKEPLAPPNGRWHYKDKDSRIIASVYRHPVGEGDKTYRPWDAKAGKAQMPEIRPLYNIPGIAGATMVVLVEGEKSADALISLGYVATTAMGGANARDDKTDWSPLRGKEVILWPDADPAGQKWLLNVTGALQAIGCTVRAVAIPEGVPAKWDAADAKEDGANIAEILHSALKPVRQSRFQWLSARDLRALPQPQWLVDSYMPENGLCLLYGASGSYKSFIALDLAFHIAHGLPWCGKVTQKKGVGYIAAEGGFGLNKRMLAWHQSHGLDLPDNFFALTSAVNLLDPKADIDEFLADTEPLRRHDLGFVIVDTLARSFDGGDENAAKDMNAFIKNCDRVRSTFNCLTMPVHHTGKDSDKGARGSSSLKAAVDTELWAERIGQSKRVRLHCTKQKDAEQALVINLDACTIELADENGEILKSAVMREIKSPIREKTYIGPTECRVVEAFEGENDGLRFTDIVRKTNKSNSSIRDSLKSLLAGGIVVKIENRYWLSPQVSPQEQD